MSESEHTIQGPPAPSIIREMPFSKNFFDRSNAVARTAYLKVFIGGCFFVVIAIFAVFPIYWGALWKTPVKNLNGWVVVRPSPVNSFTLSNIF